MNYADHQELRHVNIEGYTLQTWDSYRVDSLNKTIIGYEFKTPDGTVLFSGEDFACSPCDAIDSDECLRSLLGFLTLKPGDTDSEYFANYTPDQMAFAEGDAENLSLYSMEPEEGYPVPQFTNLDGFDSTDES